MRFSYFSGSSISSKMCSVVRRSYISSLCTCFVLGSWFLASLMHAGVAKSCQSPRMGRLFCGEQWQSADVQGTQAVTCTEMITLHFTEAVVGSGPGAEALSLCPASACPPCTLQASTASYHAPASLSLLRDTTMTASLDGP